MTHRLIIIGIIAFITLFEIWFFHRVYDLGYNAGYNDGVDKMVMTIDSIFTKRTKNLTNGMEK
jgi:hypothetical protein